MGNLLRSSEMSEKYQSYRDSGAMDTGCDLCKKKAIKSFTHWKIVENKFPYDLIAKTHRMLVPIRHVKDINLNQAEKAEFFTIKAEYLQQYDYILETTSRTKSIPEHYHLHLLSA